MTRIRSALVLVAVLALAGCGPLRGVFGSTENFTASFCATGAVAIPCRAIGTIAIPEGGEGLLSLVVQLAGPQLVRTANLKQCTFTTYAPVTTDRAITVTATATCLLQGQQVQETLTVTLAPAVVAA
jgi:hypothetical protein